MNWYYAKNGHQNGPLPTEDMIDRIAMGEIAQSDLAWCEGMGDWLPVAEIPQLKVEAPVKAESQSQAAPVSAAAPSPYQSPAAAPAPVSHQMMPGQPVSQGLAIASLVCGILSLVGCCVYPVAGPLAIVAIVLGFVTLSKVKGNPAAYGGKGMAKAGLITGFLGLLGVAVIIGLGIWMASMSPADAEKMFEKFGVPEAQRQEFRDKLEEAERAKQQP
jgi:GYF domain 2/Domain of unknown function (DUF4190)